MNLEIQKNIDTIINYHAKDITQTNNLPNIFLTKIEIEIINLDFLLHQHPNRIFLNQKRTFTTLLENYA